MNVTVALDDDLVARARDIARQQGTTLNDMIRKHLESVAGEVSGTEVAEQLKLLWASAPGHSGGRKIAREEAYEGRL